MNIKKRPRPFRSARHAQTWRAGFTVNACAVRVRNAQNALLDAEGQAFDMAIDDTPGAAYSIHAAASVNVRINGARRQLREVKQNVGLL